MKVVVALDWTPNGNHLGFYVAKDAGLYEAAGLDVRLLSPHDPEFAGSYVDAGADAAATDAAGAPAYVTPCSKVAAGDAHFAINSPEVRATHEELPSVRPI
jgi:ABC-type nitrate/sulfonate/bicarbonate transport system substrate-binding protein